jgi:hypothetical protein
VATNFPWLSHDLKTPKKEMVITLATKIGWWSLPSNTSLADACNDIVDSIYVSKDGSIYGHDNKVGGAVFYGW